MVYTVALVILCAGFCLGYPTGDQIITKLDPGSRYQYVSTQEGLRLEDLWLKSSDLQASTRFDPEVDNGYHLFTRANPQISQPIVYGLESILQNSNFDPTKKTVVLIHGWLNTPLSDFNVHLVFAYLAAEDVNVIMTDWSVGAGGSYASAILNNITSGRHVAKFIAWVNSVTGATLSRYHIIGHSLGGHQVGVVGRELDGQVAYITAMDPALPGWITNPNRITPDVSLYTEVMHTDAGLQGILHTAGHVDFYPNGGTIMPGCSSSSCNHHQCIFYMAESLVSGGFTGRLCSNLASALLGNCTGSQTLPMGGTTPKTGSTGTFYLTTNAYSPFSQG